MHFSLLRMEEDDTEVKSLVDVTETLQLQLAEIEMLESMFPNTGELRLDDTMAAINIQAFLDGKMKYDYLHTRFGFTLKIAPENCKVIVKNFILY